MVMPARSPGYEIWEGISYQNHTMPPQLLTGLTTVVLNSLRNNTGRAGRSMEVKNSMFGILGQ